MTIRLNGGEEETGKEEEKEEERTECLARKPNGDHMGADHKGGKMQVVMSRSHQCSVQSLEEYGVG